MEFFDNITDPFSLFLRNGNSSAQYWDPADSPFYAAVLHLQNVVVPIICGFGLVGNLLALGCFLSKSLRSTSCCLYMAGKCSSDSGFLLALLIIWLHNVNVNILNVQGVCQLTVFLSYVCGFMTVWFVLAITYENYIRMCRPHLTNTHCTKRVALVVVFTIVFVAVPVYSFPLWTTDVLGGVHGEELLCMALLKFKAVVLAMTFVDTVITLVAPFLIMIPLVAMSLFAVLRSIERKQRLRTSLLNRNKRSLHQSSLESKVAKFLLTVSLTFIVFHTPTHLIRLKLLVECYFLGKTMTSDDITLQRLFELFYFFNSCSNIVIFLASGANFRSIFMYMYCNRTPCTKRVADEFSMTTETKGVTWENEAFDSEAECHK